MLFYVGVKIRIWFEGGKKRFDDKNDHYFNTVFSLGFTKHMVSETESVAAIRYEVSHSFEHLRKSWSQSPGPESLTHTVKLM
jgi:hypothetical protein